MYLFSRACFYPDAVHARPVYPFFPLSHCFLLCIQFPPPHCDAVLVLKPMCHGVREHSVDLSWHAGRAAVACLGRCSWRVQKAIAWVCALEIRNDSRVMRARDRRAQCQYGGLGG